MKMRGFQYHRPSTLDDALALLGEHGDEAKVLAGGQSLVPMMAMRLSSPGQLIDIGAVAGHDAVTEADGDVIIAARVRHATMEASEIVRSAAPLVSAAAPFIGHRAIRNRGTVCGSIAHADPAAELPAVALALDARVVLQSAKDRRVVDAADFFLGYLSTAIADGELLTEVRFPTRAKRSGWSVQEVSRRHGDFALVGTAVQIDLNGSGAVARAGIALFGVGSTPVRIAAAEALLVGHRPTAASWAEAAATVAREVDPLEDNHATSAYRRHVAGVLTRRALEQASARAKAKVKP